MDSFSFVHAADLHLDSPLAGISDAPKRLRDLATQASFLAWNALVDQCVNHKVDFLLIAGDVFDWEDRSIRAQLAFRDGCVQLAGHGINTYVVHGNHDPLHGRFANMDLPPEVHVFGSHEVETVVAERQGVPVAVISGISYEQRAETRNLAAMISAQQHGSGPFSIGLLHALLGSNSRHAPYAPCTMGDLMGADIDYWALGHRHTHSILKSSPHVVYSGNIQGRSFHEPGPRGAYMVRVEDRQVRSVEFLELDVVRFLSHEFSIEPYSTIDGLTEGILDTLNTLAQKNPGRPLLCRLVLNGRGPLFGELISPTALEDILQYLRDTLKSMEPEIWVEAIDNQSQPQADLDTIMESDSLLGMVLKEIQVAAGDSHKLAAVSEHVLSPLMNNGVVARALPPLTQEEQLHLIARARNLCLELLEWEEQ